MKGEVVKGKREREKKGDKVGESNKEAESGSSRQVSR